MIDTGNAPFRQIATILQQGWTAAGLNVEIAEFDVGTAWGHTETGDYQAYVSYITSDINDTGRAGLAPGRSDRKLAGVLLALQERQGGRSARPGARQLGSGQARQDLYCQIQETVYHEGYSIPLNFVPAVNAYQDHVQELAQPHHRLVVATRTSGSTSSRERLRSLRAGAAFARFDMLVLSYVLGRLLQMVPVVHRRQCSSRS